MWLWTMDYVTGNGSSITGRKKMSCEFFSTNRAAQATLQDIIGDSMDMIC
jgi:hypothetical protein